MLLAFLNHHFLTKVVSFDKVNLMNQTDQQGKENLEKCHVFEPTESKTSLLATDVSIESAKGLLNSALFWFSCPYFQQGLIELISVKYRLKK